jgi:hypothetical protein
MFRLSDRICPVWYVGVISLAALAAQGHGLEPAAPRD